MASSVLSVIVRISAIEQSRRESDLFYFSSNRWRFFLSHTSKMIRPSDQFKTNTLVAPSVGYKIKLFGLQSILLIDDRAASASRSGTNRVKFTQPLVWTKSKQHVNVIVIKYLKVIFYNIISKIS